jgi:hypothetical protein
LVALAFAAAALVGCDERAGEPVSPGERDASARDAAAVAHDAAVRIDAALPDAAMSDDGGVSIMAPVRPFTPPELDLPDPEQPGEYWLSQTGLYTDIASKQLAPDLREFEPAHVLWSDGAEKHRWLRLPEGERIDSGDMDEWLFPIGTVLFKEFAQDGKRLETRLITRTGEGDDDYWMGAFVWRDDESDALFVPDGQRDVRGTGHDVPEVKNCFTCHNGARGRVLGFSAVQQPDAQADVLSVVPEVPFVAPGDVDTGAALGYLHANCAHCHNPRGSARPDADMDLRLSVGDRTLEETYAYRTTVGVELQNFDDTALTLRVAPGDPAQSALLFRMTERGPKTQMPPLATEITDSDGIALVRAFIEAL